MSAMHAEILDRIEHEVSADGACVEAVDERIAAELGVSVECYVGYLLVWGAIERYRQRFFGDSCPPVLETVDVSLVHAHGLADIIGGTAARIYQETAGAGHSDVNGAAARVIAAAMQLRTCLVALARPSETLATSAQLSEQGAAIAS